MAALYKTWTLMRHARRLDEVIQSREIGYFHYMRIFGLLNQRLARRHPDVVFSMTVPTHIDRGFPLHSAYHLLKLLGFKGMDRLVATCEATANKLQDLGVPGSNIETIRWSFEPTASSVDEEQRNELRRRLQLDDSRPIVLWSGPLQDTGEQELLWSVEVARRVTETNGGAQFVFAFKPDTLSDRFRRIARAIPKVGFLETTRTQFDALQSMASVFLSPICKKRRTVAPPLTWIEMMQRAVPVLTTSVAGVDEALTHGVDGYVASDTDDAVRILLETDSDKVISAGRQAAVTASTRFNLPSIIDEYAEMWQRVAVAKGPVG
jgi:glycosyltransferase involved in cell wall biosynthesis